MKFLLAILSVAAFLALSRAGKKSNNWDDLEAVLSNLDDIDKRLGDSFYDDDGDDAWVAKDVDPPNLSREQKNPCEGINCGWGKECMVTKKKEPSCECVRRCPFIRNADQFDKVCSNQNDTFESLCDLYRERCLCKRDQIGCKSSRHVRAHLEYLGPCKELPPCPQSMMSQFAGRMADWLFQVMRDMKKKQRLHGDQWLDMVEEAEQDDHMKHVYPVIWKYCDLDKKPHDKRVTKQELIPLTAGVIPMESCIRPFLEECDSDGDGFIKLHEWGRCLGLKKEEISERC